MTENQNGIQQAEFRRRCWVQEEESVGKRYQRKESSTERELQRLQRVPISYSVEYELVHVCEKIAGSQGNNQLKGRGLTGPRTVPILTGQSENLIIHGAVELSELSCFKKWD